MKNYSRIGLPAQDFRRKTSKDSRKKQVTTTIRHNVFGNWKSKQVQIGPKWTYVSTAFQNSSSPASSDFDGFFPEASGFAPGLAAPGFGVPLMLPGFCIPAIGGSGGAFAFGFGRPDPGAGDPAGLRTGV